MNVSIVSVSRRAAPPHFGHVTFTNSGTPSNGDRPVPVISTFAGNTTGNLIITAGAGSTSPNSSNIYIANYLTNFTTITTAAGGQYMLSMVNLMVLMDLEVHLGSPSGANVVWAQSVTALFGTVDGGNPSNSVYYDPGFPLDDSGYFITGFIGFP